MLIRHANDVILVSLVLIWTYFTPHPIVFIVDFKQINFWWEDLLDVVKQ